MKKFTLLLFIIPFISLAQGPWEFNTATDVEGWEGSTTRVNSTTACATAVSQSGTSLIVQTTSGAAGRNPNIYNPLANISLATNTALEINLKNNGGATWIRFWVSLDGGALNTNNNIPGFIITANDASFQTYFADLSGIASTSTITQIYLEFKVDASNSNGGNYTPSGETIEIDYIRPVTPAVPTVNSFTFDTTDEGFNSTTRASVAQAAESGLGTLEVTCTNTNPQDFGVSLNAIVAKVDGDANKYGHVTLKNTSTNNSFYIRAGTDYFPFQAFTTSDSGYTTYDFNLNDWSGDQQPELRFGVESNWSGTATYAVSDQVVFQNTAYDNITGVNTTTLPKDDPTNWAIVGSVGDLLDLTNSIFVDSVVFDSDPGDIVVLSTSSVENDFAFTAFPNPVKDILTIDSPEGINQVSVYSVLGRLVKKEQVKSNRYNLDMSSLTNGLYFVRLENNNGIASKRIIKN